MEADELHGRYTELLIDRAREVQYPSKGVMDRIERTLTFGDRKLALEYAEALIEKADTQYPSLELLDRLNRVLFVLKATAPDEDQEG
ncbi:MAG: hypothetical protein ACJ77A_06050 [Actinomycetota bacterium]